MSRATPPPLKRPPPRPRGDAPPPLRGRDALKEALAEIGSDDDEGSPTSGDASEGEWLFKEGDVVKGPVPAAVLIERIESGEADAETPVAREMGQWFPLTDVPYFAEVLEAAVERREAEIELQRAKARRRNTLIARVVLMFFIASAPAVAGTAVGYGVVKSQFWDDTKEWVQRPPPLVDLPPKPKKKPKPPKVAKKADPADEPPKDDDTAKEAAEGDDKDKKVAAAKKRDDDDRRRARRKRSRARRAKSRAATRNASKKRAARKKRADKRKDKKKDGKPKIRSLNQKQIMGGLKKGYRGFKRCIGKEIERNPDMPGRITMAFSVANNGKAINFKLLERQVRKGPLRECMAKVVGRLRWPKFYGERKYVEFPLNIKK